MRKALNRPRLLIVVLVVAIALTVVLATTDGPTGWLGGSTKQAAKPPPAIGNLGGPLRQGCSYLFHDSVRWQSISGTWKGKTLRWDHRPQDQGRWTAEQERAVRENAAVAATVTFNGFLTPTEPPQSLANCFKVWNRTAEAWQRTVASNFKAAWVAGWEATS